MQVKQQTNSAWLFENDWVEDWAWIPVFNEDECDKIIEYCKQYEMVSGKIIGTELDLSQIRKSDIVFIQPDRANAWVWEKLSAAVNSVNDRFFKFQLYGFTEGLQFTEYKAPDGKYDLHIDKLTGGLVRKLSTVIQLSDPNDYDGGDFELLIDHKPLKLPRDRGMMLAFPSYSCHQVIPVTSGIRHSLVGWVSGPPFK